MNNISIKCLKSEKIQSGACHGQFIINFLKPGQGITIGNSDILIAGIAIANDFTLVTNNEKHYESIRNLGIENCCSFGGLLLL
jgi:predicted nucleic acid-binding protein